MDMAYDNPIEKGNLEKYEFETEGGIQFRFYALSQEALDIKEPHEYSNGKKINNLSLLTILEYNGFKMVYPGDLEEKGFEKLLERPEVKEALKGTDILVASHHGRDSGYHADLFDIIEPKHVILSDKKNSDTSVPEKYRSKVVGGDVDGEERFVLTTRKDSVMRINVNQSDFNLETPQANSD
jgi:competence protein ComEC